MRRPLRLRDPAHAHCTTVDGNSSHVRCNYCKHTMRGGVSRLKEHLARKRGNVVACKKCPENVTSEMRKLLARRASEIEEEENNMMRQSSEIMRDGEAEGGLSRRTNAEIDEERILLERAIQESLRTYEMEKKTIARDEDEFEAACRASKLSYQQELQRRGEGCSGTKPWPPNEDYNCNNHINLDDSDSDYDSD
ncbi:hypothetical protein SLEP1_g28619 [Rubroshorea leprosula]|uniref:BED-type domain-containing protein n=1 Tax=Rubroshorea leprosula TaxID=152421 RepID=A0AAV5JU79_9ROSI|nr:hypothetical protein SLEP1_g28619 [Rubroshorea leprosula]